MPKDIPKESLLSCYQRIQPHLQAQVENITQDSYVAEDILQETIVRGFQESQIKPIRSPNSWLRRVSYNLAVDYRRGKRHFSLREDSVPTYSSSLDDECNSPSTRIPSETSLEKMVRRLPKRYSQVLTLHYWQGLGFREIGERLEISEGMAKSIAYHGRRQLRRQLTGSPNVNHSI